MCKQEYSMQNFMEKAKKYTAADGPLLALQEINALQTQLNSSKPGIVKLRNSGAPRYVSDLKRFRWWMDNLFAGHDVPTEGIASYWPVLQEYQLEHPKLKERIKEIENCPRCKSLAWV